MGARTFVHNEDFTLTSADLSAASDFIPHDIALAVWDGICEALGDNIPPLYHTIGQSLLGPMSWDGGKEKDLAFTSKRGILMGLPLTWPILSILNHFAGHKAMEQVHAKYAYMPRSSQLEPYVSCGDDFAAAWTSRHEEFYFETIADLGLVLNEHKTFSSKRTLEGITSKKNGLVFVERLFVATLPEKVKVTSKRDAVARAMLGPMAIREPVLTVLHRPTLSAVLSAKSTGATEEEVPLHYKLGPILTQEALKCNKIRTGILCDIASNAHSQVVGRMRKTGVPLHWPIDLGGWGFPGKQEAPPHWRKAAATILVGAETLQGRLRAAFNIAQTPEHLRGVVKTNLKLIERFRRVDSNGTPIMNEQILDLPLNWSEDPFRKANPNNVVPLEDAQSEATFRICAFHSRDFYLNKQGSRKCKTIDQVANTIKATINHAVSQWKSAKPMSSDKAVQLSKERKETLVDIVHLDATLHFHGCPDRVYDLSKSRTVRSEKSESKVDPRVAQSTSAASTVGLMGSPELLYSANLLPDNTQLPLYDDWPPPGPDHQYRKPLDGDLLVNQVVPDNWEDLLLSQEAPD
jgi:hypothetical protein